MGNQWECCNATETQDIQEKDIFADHFNQGEISFEINEENETLKGMNDNPQPKLIKFKIKYYLNLVLFTKHNRFKNQKTQFKRKKKKHQCSKIMLEALPFYEQATEEIEQVINFENIENNSAFANNDVKEINSKLNVLASINKNQYDVTKACIFKFYDHDQKKYKSQIDEQKEISESNFNFINEIHNQIENEKNNVFP